MPESVRPRVRPRYVVAALVCAAAVAWLLIGGLASNIVYLRPVSEAVERRDEQGDKRFRLGGEVVPGSIVETADGVRFELTDGKATVAVVNHGSPPDLFEDGAPIVCEGRWQGDTFDSDRILIRHGNEYQPPDVGSESLGTQ